MLFEQLKCDYCGTTSPSLGVIGWWRLDRIGIDTRVGVERDLDGLTFCSVAHVAAVALPRPEAVELWAGASDLMTILSRAVSEAQYLIEAIEAEERGDTEAPR